MRTGRRARRSSVRQNDSVDGRGPAHPIRVAIVDDQEMFIAALRGLLEVEHDIEIVGTVTSPRQLDDIASAADVVLMDLRLPTADGLDLTRQVRQTRPAQQVVVISGRSDDQAERDALAAGAAAFLLKGGLGVEVAATVRRVAGR